MSFSIIYLLESCLLIANALGILSERVLSKYGLDKPMQQNENSGSQFGWKNQVAIMLYFFRYFGKTLLIAGNVIFILYELVLG